MSTSLHADISISTGTLRATIDEWFTDRGFGIAVFEARKLRIVTHSMGQTIVFKLTERPGHTTYHKESTSGALIVFEVLVTDHRITQNG